MRFDPVQLEALIGGLNTLDIPRLNISESSEAKDFLFAYGFDLNKEEDLKRMRSYHRRAVTYVQTEILKPDEKLPDLISDPEALQDITKLLIFASSPGHELQSWSCGVLRVMHAFAHLDNDLFTYYSTEIQEQILKPIQAHIHEDSVLGTHLGPALGEKSIGIRKFEVKTFKATSSSITKLLAKPELVAFSLMDKVGIRFVTRHLVDVFRVMRYMMEQNIICFAHNIPDQSNNTLYPLNLFIEVIEGLDRKTDIPADEIDRLLKEKLQAEQDRAMFKEKRNKFTSREYKFVKFITRRLIHIPEPKLSFFYPFEVQIMDYETYISNTTGDASHEKYKERQVSQVRARIFGLKSESTNALH